MPLHLGVCAVEPLEPRVFLDASAYRIVGIDVPHGVASEAFDINDRGEVVGRVYRSDDPDFTHAFIWSARKGAKDLGTLGGRASSAWAINENGDVVGGADGKDHRPHPFLFDGTRMQRLGTARTSGEAWSINNQGQVGASLKDSSGMQHAVVFDGSKVVEIGTSKPSEASSPLENSGAVFKVNDHGQVLAAAHTFSRQRIFSVSKIDFSALAPIGMNNHDLLVGTDYADGSGVVIKNGVVKRRFNVDNSEQTMPLDVNDHGVIVGNAGINALHASPFIYQQNSWHYLKDLIPSKSGWYLTSAYSINDSGQIVGTGRYRGIKRAFVLTPRSRQGEQGISMRGLNERLGPGRL